MSKKIIKQTWAWKEDPFIERYIKSMIEIEKDFVRLHKAKTILLEGYLNYYTSQPTDTIYVKATVKKAKSKKNTKK